MLLVMAACSSRRTRLCLQLRSLAFWNGHYPVTECRVFRVKPTFRGCVVFGTKLFQILLVRIVLRSFFVLRKPSVVLLFRAVGLTLARLAFLRGKHLPSFAHDLGDLCEGKILSFQEFSDFCKSSVLHCGILLRHLRFENMT